MVARAYQTESFTPQEYLELERHAQTKSEYFNGQIFAMAAISRDHNRITVAASSALGEQLRKSTHEPFASNMHVKIGPTGDYVYPDVIVACEPQFEDEQFDILLNPRVIIEVLSPSTADFDHNGKFALYQTLPSVTDYILIAQDQPRIEHFARQDDNSWLLRIFEGLDGEVEIGSVNCVLRAAGVYERVSFGDTDE